MYSWQVDFSCLNANVAWYLKYFSLPVLFFLKELLDDNHILINKPFILLKQICIFFSWKVDIAFSSLTQMPLVHLLSATAWIDLFWTERVEYGWLFCLRSHIGTMVVNFFCSVWILYILRLYLLFSALQTVNGPSHPSSIISTYFFTFLGFFSITSKNFTKFSKFEISDFVIANLSIN